MSTELPDFKGRVPKEMRCFRRDGDLIIEEHEKLNPDGTVTKTITTTDEKTGQKQVSAYKMEKSGIVRKLNDLDQKPDFIQQLKDEIEETRDEINAMKEQNEVNNKSVAYETGPYFKNGISYTKRVEEETPDKHEMAYNLRNINKPIELTPRQRAMIQEHKENILNYGTQKLIKQLNKKLNDDKFNESYTLTDEQKDKVIEYGVRKLHRLLEKNLDEERLIYDVMAFNPDFGKVDLSGRGTMRVPGNQSVSFKLNPYKDISPEEISKPVSFSMRPEKPSKPINEPEPEVYGDRKVINNGYKSLWNRLMNPQSTMENVTEGKSTKNDSNDDHENDNYDWQKSTENNKPTDKEDFKKLKNSVKKLITDDEMYKKSSLSPEQKEGIIDYALQQVRSVFKNSINTEDEKKSMDKQKKKINLLEYFDEDEIFDYGKRALRKLVRKSLKNFNVDQDMLKHEKLDDPEKAVRRDAFYQYLGDVVEGRVKESEPMPTNFKNSEEGDEPEQEKKWDYASLLSSIFGQKEKDKMTRSEKVPKEKNNKDKVTDFDSILSWFRSDKEKEEKSETVKEPNEASETVPRIKPRFYQLEPEAENKNGQSQAEGESRGFDLKSLLRKIQEAAVKKFSDTKQPENTENLNQGSNIRQEQTQARVSHSSSQESQERDFKQSDIDSKLSQSRQNNNSGRSSNKPPYLKERISGLDSIPRPKVISVSPYARNTDYSDQVSFQLKPHYYENQKEEDKVKPLENQRIETGKPSSHEQDFQPWWFESPDSVVKKAFTEKPLIKDGFVDAPMINSSFSSGRNGFSTASSFSDNLLE